MHFEVSRQHLQQVLFSFFDIFNLLADFNLFILLPLITASRGVAINEFLVKYEYNDFYVVHFSSYARERSAFNPLLTLELKVMLHETIRNDDF